MGVDINVLLKIMSISYYGLCRTGNVMTNGGKMKVIYVASDNNAASGAFICLVHLAEEMIRRGIDAKVILPGKGDGVRLLEEAGIPFITIKSYSWDIPIDAGLYLLSKVPVKRTLNYFSIYRIWRYLKEEKPDIVHINTIYSYVAAIASYKLNIPVVWHIREFFEEDQNNRMWNRSEGYSIMNKADEIITVSNAVYDKYKKVFSAEKMKVIHDGVLPQKFYCPDREIFESSIVKMVCVGGLYPYKGQELLIEAIEKCIKNNKDNRSMMVLRIVGRGSEEKRLKDAVEKKGLQNVVIFEGFSSEPEKYYKEADIAFMSSKSEAFGLVTVEAMLAGALVIGTDSAGTKDIITDKETGLLYKVGDVERLSDTIEYALNNKEMMKKIAANGRKRAMEAFTVSRNADSIMKVYEKVKNHSQ